mmetsp:Transcript_9864/g.60080  ORF Transcript_9864/g.60080 Transcript_9864/m.60080 type:complete len:148 (+) Transcript_9864:270-713(+)
MKFGKLLRNTAEAQPEWADAYLDYKLLKKKLKALKRNEDDTERNGGVVQLPENRSPAVDARIESHEGAGSSQVCVRVPSLWKGIYHVQTHWLGDVDGRAVRDGPTQRSDMLTCLCARTHLVAILCCLPAREPGTYSRRTGIYYHPQR